MCHIYFYKRALDSKHPIFDMWQPTIIIQVIQCMSVMATCIPYLKPFMDSLQSGQMNASEITGTRTAGSYGRSRSGYTSQGSGLRGNTAIGLTSVTAMATKASHRRQKYEMIDMDKSADRGNKKKAAGTPATAGGSWDGQSHNSQTVLVEQTWRVDVETKTATPGAT